MKTQLIQRINASVFLIVGGILFGSLPAWAGHGTELPAAARQAIQVAFPDGKIVEVGRESEKGVKYYEVDLTWQGRKLGVEVTADGALGEIEESVKPEALPAAVAAKMTELVGTGKVRKIEKHEIRGVPRKGTFAPLPEPRIVYEIKVRASNRRKVEIRLDQTGKVLGPEDEDGDDGAEDDEDDD